jgi:hypothetical protein
MLKMYLDHNVYQDLKKEENSHVLAKIHKAKNHVIFCFSEAHLYDLNQDKTEQKFADMDFIGTIAENHCYAFTDRTQFTDRTPREYYNDFDWSHTFDLEDLDDPLWAAVVDLFKAMPLDFKPLLEGNELPIDMPEAMRNILLEPTTMYDFMNCMLDLSDNLTKEQKEFKNLIKYMHNNSLLGEIYNGMGIKGYDGKKITDRNAFYESYSHQFIREGQSKTRYSLYSDMYHGLEFYGFVKGKPRKQKMMNLINDARHSFFGTVCDVIVSKDIDFLDKTRFMYQVEGISTGILNFSELEAFLDEQERLSSLSIAALFKEVSEPLDEHRIIDTVEEESEKRIYVELQNSYYSYFNLMLMISDQHGNYWSICRKLINYNNVPFKLQIRHIVSRLLSELGNDLHNKGEFTFAEQLDNQTEIRCWAIENIVISLILDEILYLNIYPLEYLQKRWKKTDSEVA